MILFLVSYIGGALTIVSPCILPLLPFVFARTDQPFAKSGFPLLLGMAITFAGVASLAAIGGGWAVQANQFGRIAAIILVAFFGTTLLFPSLADRLTRPLVSLGARLSRSASNGTSSTTVASSFLLGIATGLLWAPCAGPVLGLLLTGAALNGASVQTSFLLLAYAAGAATSLALALLIGGKVFVVMKRSLGAGEWIRRGLGAAVLAGVAVIALGLDTGYLTQISLASTSRLEQTIVDTVRPKSSREPSAPLADNSGGPGNSLPVEGQFPPLVGAVEWLNSPPLTVEGLRGKVVLVDFWTYSCINCLRAVPYVRAWAEKYKDQGLVVIGVHAPEFAFEKDVANVRKAATDLKIDYPIAIDNNYEIWRAFRNEYWPAHYFIDVQGRVRYHHFGEGEYDRSEKVIQQLLAEAGKSNVSTDLVTVKAAGVEAAANKADMITSETYLGYDRGSNFVSIEDVGADVNRIYSAPPELQLNQWALAGQWTIENERSVLNRPGGRISFRFHARDLHLVLGPQQAGKPVRFRLTIDGTAPGTDHGMDVDEQGNGTVTDQRLYQLVRQKGAIEDKLFEIEFLDSGAQAFAFTFG
ncbi:cytochrome c biogenesis protein DipZ [Phyllobacterium sp. SB3]|uniref:cytochrome c biogenesis protein DipZ n=1 Tax=Phyllobacterium sp. SB3 TaxID=3156073 RepID=UPI0032AEEFDF